jgi:hypothetical protein
MSIETVILIMCVSSGIAGKAFGAIFWWKWRPRQATNISEIVKNTQYHLLQETGE